MGGRKGSGGGALGGRPKGGRGPSGTWGNGDRSHWATHSHHETSQRTTAEEDTSAVRTSTDTSLNQSVGNRPALLYAGGRHASTLHSALQSKHSARTCTDPQARPLHDGLDSQLAETGSRMAGLLVVSVAFGQRGSRDLALGLACPAVDASRKDLTICDSLAAMPRPSNRSRWGSGLAASGPCAVWSHLSGVPFAAKKP